jgi:hypothetical protein
MSSKTELFNDSIFVDSSSTLGQINSSAIGAVSSSNLYQTGNFTDYRTFRLSPYWTPHLNGYAEGELRLSYSYFANNNTHNTSSSTGTGIGNLGSDSYQESLHLKSGRKFNASGATWRLSLNNQEQHNQSSSSSAVRFRSYNGELSHVLINDINAFTQIGYYDNQYSGSITAKNGLYVTPGLSWTPSPNFSLAAGYGYKAYFGNVNWHPSEHTSFQLNYRNSQVGGSNYGIPGFGGGGLSSGYGYGGLATSSTAIAGFDYNPVGGTTAAGSTSPTGALGANNAGSTWNGSLNHRTRTTNWTASYYTATTTIQQILSSSPTFTAQHDAFGNPITELTPIERAVNTPNLTDGIIISKRAQGSVTWTLSKSNLYLSFYHNDLNYSSGTSRPQTILGVTASWNWRFSSRMNAILQGTWQTSDYHGGRTSVSSGPTSTDYLTASISLSRQLSSFATGSLQFFHSQANSNGLSGISSTSNSYDVNRVVASVSVNF